MSPEPSKPRPLEYATFDADGLPPYEARAEAVISAGGKPGQIRKFFRTSALALKYFLKSMRRRHAIETLGDRCEMCGESCLTYLTADWTVTMAPGLHEWVTLRSAKFATFRTSHTICELCRGRWEHHLRWMKRVWRIAIGSIVFAWMFYIVTRWWTLPPSWSISQFIADYGFGTFCVAAGLPQLAIYYGPGGYPRELQLPRRMRCRMISPLVTRPALDDVPPAAIVEAT